MAHLADYVRAPLSSKTYVFEKEEEDPDEFELTRSVIEMPNTAPQPLNGRKDRVPAGTIERHRLKSEILENERPVWVYTPAGYDPDRPGPYDVLVLLDGTGFAKTSPLAAILDNLVASSDIPPLVAVMPCSLSQAPRFKELLLYEPFNEFLTKELMPWAHETSHLTDDPSRVVVGGASAGARRRVHGVRAPRAIRERALVVGAFLFSPGC